MACADGLVLAVQSVSQGKTDRHARMLVNREFDAAEVSLSSYVMAKVRGAPLTAIPVFTRRLFSASGIYCDARADIRSPKDLQGRRVGLNSYQQTFCVQARGDLQHFYGVDLRQITWVVSGREVVPFQVPKGITLQKMPEGKTTEDMLAEGEIDALLASRTPMPFGDHHAGVARLFQDARKDEATYFRKQGFYPIMHTVAIRDELLESQPWIASSLFQAFEAAKRACYSRYDDPNWSHLVWGRLLYEEVRELLGDDPWPNGVEANRANLETFVSYSAEQGLIQCRPSLEELFAEVRR